MVNNELRTHIEAFCELEKLKDRSCYVQVQGDSFTVIEPHSICRITKPANLRFKAVLPVITKNIFAIQAKLATCSVDQLTRLDATLKALRNRWQKKNVIWLNNEQIQQDLDSYLRIALESKQVKTALSNAGNTIHQAQLKVIAIRQEINTLEEETGKCKTRIVSQLKKWKHKAGLTIKMNITDKIYICQHAGLCHARKNFDTAFVRTVPFFNMLFSQGQQIDAPIEIPVSASANPPSSSSSQQHLIDLIYWQSLPDTLTIEQLLDLYQVVEMKLFDAPQQPYAKENLHRKIEKRIADTPDAFIDGVLFLSHSILQTPDLIKALGSASIESNGNSRLSKQKLAQLSLIQRLQVSQFVETCTDRKQTEATRGLCCQEIQAALDSKPPLGGLSDKELDALPLWQQLQLYQLAVQQLTGSQLEEVQKIGRELIHKSIAARPRAFIEAVYFYYNFARKSEEVAAIIGSVSTHLPDALGSLSDEESQAFTQFLTERDDPQFLTKILELIPTVKESVTKKWLKHHFSNYQHAKHPAFVHALRLPNILVTTLDYLFAAAPMVAPAVTLVPLVDAPAAAARS